MKLSEAIQKAVQTRDAQLARKIADILRFREGLSYPQSYAFVNQRAPISVAGWEALLYESEG